MPHTHECVCVQQSGYKQYDELQWLACLDQEWGQGTYKQRANRCLARTWGGRFMPRSTRLLMCCSGMSMYLHTCMHVCECVRVCGVCVCVSRWPASMNER